MPENNQVIELTTKPGFATRTKQATLAVATYMAVQAVWAASSIPTEGLTGEIDGSKATVILLFGAAIVILGMFAGWRYLKRGANSA